MLNLLNFWQGVIAVPCVSFELIPETNVPVVLNVFNLFQMEISYYLSWRRGHAEGRGCNENTQETGELIGGVRDDLVCFTGCGRSKYVERSYFFTLQKIAEKSFSYFIILQSDIR